MARFYPWVCKPSNYGIEIALPSALSVIRFLHILAKGSTYNLCVEAPRRALFQNLHGQAHHQNNVSHTRKARLFLTPRETVAEWSFQRACIDLPNFPRGASRSLLVHFQMLSWKHEWIRELVSQSFAHFPQWTVAMPTYAGVRLEEGDCHVRIRRYDVTMRAAFEHCRMC